jgi:polyphosphate kinase
MPRHAHKPGATPRDLDDPGLYVNPNVARIRFMERVLEEAEDSRLPLLERTKFLAILGSNLDEMFMVRIAELRRLAHAGSTSASADGLSPAQTLSEVRREVLPILERGSSCWRNGVLPGLKESGIQILSRHELDRTQQRRLRRYFHEHIFPVLTPLAVDPGHPFPHISNLSVNLAAVLEDPKRGQQFARIKVPNVFPRFLPLPRNGHAPSVSPSSGAAEMAHEFIWIEEAISANIGRLFPGLNVEAVFPFRVTRDASVDVKDIDADDLLSVVEETVDRRGFGPAVRLEMIDAPAGHPVRDLLTRHLGLAPDDVYETAGPLGKVDLWELTHLNRPDLKVPPIEPVTPPFLRTGEPICDVLRRRDVLLYHPYESFTPVLEFVRQASRDPQVLAIKQTLYRIDKNSPIVAALLEARENGKQVAVLMELKARFDEERNIAWARTLEKAGVHVTYGLPGLKTHAKMCLVVRREGDRIARYVHLGTGNYNTETARMYSDIGFLTSRPDFGADVTELFNSLTGYARKPRYRTLLVAPGALRRAFLSRIDREIRRHQRKGDGYLAFKMNGLEDKECIQALYRASRAGVKIDLQVRGFCCLRPGLQGVSDNITVTSVVGRFLEHARIYYFHNGGNEEILVGSADMMPRNLDRRVELLFPVEDSGIRTAIRDRILAIHLLDNVKARWMQPDGRYVHLRPAPRYPEMNSQRWMAQFAGTWNRYGESENLKPAGLAPLMRRRKTLPGELEARAASGKPPSNLRGRSRARRSGAR